jgi:lipopolysaccharide/colanic/teichoic acid biosynthesis glycosyltransferase
LPAKAGKIVFRGMLERLTAGGALLLCLPAFVVAGACIAAESGFPVLFRQRRVGRLGTTFTLLKLRSMRDSNCKSSITRSGDPRVTRVGKFLRRYKIDELPQLWNIVAGDMQFVGPRPEVPSMVDFTDPTWKRVLSERPGLTDLSTLAYRDEEYVLGHYSDPERAYREIVLPEKLRLSARYLETRTVWSDCKLLALSVWYSFFPSGFEPGRLLGIFAGQQKKGMQGADK